jgi:thiol-disulfide isomerase/thioredoxin
LRLGLLPMTGTLPAMKRLALLVAAAVAVSACGGTPAGGATVGDAATVPTSETPFASGTAAATTSTTATTTSTTTTTSPVSEFGTVAVTGDDLPVLETADDPAIGLLAPEITGTDFSGNEVSIAHDGEAKAIVFLAHWCPHCQSELPELTDFLAEGGVEDVSIIAVATGTNPTRPNYPPSVWFAEENWTRPLIADDENLTVLRAFGGPAFPFWTFLAPDGTVALRVAGRIDMPTLQSILEQLPGL